MGKPGDRVGFAAAGGVLDEITAARSIRGDMRQRRPHDFQLVEAGKDLHGFLPPRFFACPPKPWRRQVPGLDDLRVVFENVRQASRREDALPKIIRLESVRVRRISGAIVPTLVEGEKPGRLALELRAKHHLVLIQREMRHAAAQFEELLAWVAVTAVLLDGVFDGLLREAVL